MNLVALLIALLALALAGDAVRSLVQAYKHSQESKRMKKIIDRLERQKREEERRGGKDT